jgi:putative sigma-54 modulation protein
MTVEIRFRGLARSAGLRQRVMRRIHFHLGRFAPSLLSVRVRIEDVNGPKGGLDKRCQFEVRGPRIGAAIVEQLSSDALSAVDGAAGRTGHAVARLLQRRRARSGGGARQSVRGT